MLPGVEMALVNEQGVKWSTPTDGEGRFEFAPVGAGKYVLEASIPGFRTFNRTSCWSARRTGKGSSRMQLGAAQETIR